MVRGQGGCFHTALIKMTVLPLNSDLEYLSLHSLIKSAIILPRTQVSAN